MIQSILDRELISKVSDVKILLVDKDKEDFINFLQPLGCKFLYYDDLYYGNNNPNLLLCNNKIDYYNACRNLVITYHIPSIIIDHNIKSNLLDNEKIKFIDNLPGSFKVATSLPIYRSWHNIHNKVIPHNTDSLDIWAENILQVSRRKFDL